MKKFKVLSICMALVLMAGLVFAATPSTLKKNVWKAEQVFKKGITAYGSVTVDGVALSGNAVGDVWYVDSASGANTRGNDYGESWEKPFDTVDYAINQCTANNGDIIHVLPGHAESYTAADGFYCSRAGRYD